MTRRETDSDNWGGARTPDPGKVMGRPRLPPEERTVARNISLPQASWEWIDELAKRIEKSRSQVFQAWIDEQRRNG